jgi:3-deoxy-D-manno-octulosonate 8-phosphate phosphatase (KDO 8-P phosphatase)
MSNYKEKLMPIKCFIFDYDGVLTDGTVYPSADGDMMRAANVKDGYALQLAVKKGYRIAIISGGQSKSMEKRMKALKITDVYLGVHNKKEVYDDFVKKYGLKTEEILYMGDDIPDYQLLKTVGVATCPSDAAEEILEIVDYISHKPGGKGAVRDILRQVMKLQGKWFDKDAFFW